MADAFRQDFVAVNFVAGEMPDHYKLTGVVNQLKLAAEKLCGAVGDLLNQQVFTSTTGQYYLDDMSLVGPNLSRIIGSAGWLNPRQIGRIRVTDQEVNFNASAGGGWGATVDGTSCATKKIFMLPAPPILFSSVEGAELVEYTSSYSSGVTWSLSAPATGADATATGSGKVVTRVSSLASLNTSGEYYVGDDGLIVIYDGLDIATSEGFKVTYTYDTHWDSYDGANLCVIPDFSQTTTLCAVTLVGAGLYEIVLPTMTNRRGLSPSYPSVTENAPYYNGIFDPYSWTGTITSPMYEEQATLPRFLTDNLSNGDVIPSNYIQLYDDSGGTVLSDGVFTYVSSTTVRVTGLTLVAGSTRYRIVVPGTNLAKTLSYLRHAFYRHDHTGIVDKTTGVWPGEKLHHYNFLHNVDEGTTTKAGFVPSLAGPQRNPHPQYLHRYGYQYGESISDGGNVDNALLGDLVLAGNDETISLTPDSFKLLFGTGNSSTSPGIYFSTAINTINVQNSLLYAEDGLITDGILASNITLTGNVIFNAVKTCYLKLRPSDAWYDPTEWTHYSYVFVESVMASDASQRIIFPIHIPDGATITGVQAIVDPHDTGAMELRIVRTYNENWLIANEGTVASLGTDSSSGTSLQFLTVSGLSTVTDYETESYYVYIDSAQSSDLVYAVRVKYTVENLLPSG
jgi:hypothetical protein